MKLVSSVLENVEGIQIFYIVGLLIFVILFVAIFFRTMKRPNKEMSDIKKSILLDDDSEELITS